jgi:metal-responsive CopG/Arc/MetJ family transcriptional regulator
MKTVQMTLDERLVKEVDAMIQIIGTTRSAFTRQALQHELDAIRSSQLEQKHIAGYTNFPVREGEFDGWEDEQVWSDV